MIEVTETDNVFLTDYLSSYGATVYVELEGSAATAAGEWTVSSFSLSRRTFRKFRRNTRKSILETMTPKIIGETRFFPRSCCSAISESVLSQLLVCIMIFSDTIRYTDLIVNYTCRLFDVISHKWTTYRVCLTDFSNATLQ